MNVTNLFDQLHDPYADHDDEVTAKRSELLTHLTYGIRVMEHAAELLDDLAAELGTSARRGRDGRDCAAHLDAHRFPRCLRRSARRLRERRP